MASIEERKRADGTTAYKAEVVIRVDGKRKKKSATFDREVTARAWSKRIEKQLKAGGAEEIFEARQERKTVADAIEKYMTSTAIDLKSTKKQVLGFVRDKRCKFSELYLDELAAHDIREFAAELARGDRGPATISSYLTHVCHVLSVAEDDFGPAYRVSLDALTRGKKSARRNGLAGKPSVRDRRPDIDEIDALMQYFIRRYEADERTVPMHFIVPFAIFGCRRMSEIVNLRWSDLEDNEMLVRGTKHPRKPEGLDLHTIITDEAKRIIGMHGTRNEELIFPYHRDTISRLFTEACKICEIEDLHFHDLRHEGISWLREKGWSVSHVMLVSGHSSTQTLDRYTRLKERGDKYEDWKWWPVLEKL